MILFVLVAIDQVIDIIHLMGQINIQEASYEGLDHRRNRADW